MEHIPDEYSAEAPGHALALVGEQRDGGTGTFSEDTEHLAHRFDSVVAVPDRSGGPTHAGRDRTACSCGTDTSCDTNAQRRRVRSSSFRDRRAHRVPAVPAHGPKHDLTPEVASLEIAHPPNPSLQPAQTVHRPCAEFCNRAARIIARIEAGRSYPCRPVAEAALEHACRRWFSILRAGASKIASESSLVIPYFSQNDQSRPPLVHNGQE